MNSQRQQSVDETTINRTNEGRPSRREFLLQSSPNRGWDRSGGLLGNLGHWGLSYGADKEPDQNRSLALP